MTDEKIKLLEQSPVEAAQLLRVDLRLFIKIFHYYITKQEFVFKPFHHKIIDKLESIVYEKPHNLVISISPRFGKSAIMRYFVAWTYSINKGCNNIYTSYSDELVRQFSGEIRDIVNSQLYNKLFHIKIKEDTQNKGLWQVDGGGSVRACSMGGSITGFGAGNTNRKGYGGCILIDDALKADDAHSESSKKACWNYFTETLVSRRNSENTPIIIIMQRLAVDDIVALLKKNKYEFEYLEIPVLDENDESIWPERYSTEALHKLRREQPAFFAAQYMQNPMVEGGNLFKDYMFVRGPMPSGYDYTFITCDTASTSKTTSDYTAAGFWGVRTHEDGSKRLYLLDLLWDKIDASKIEEYLVPFIKKHSRENFIGALIEPKGHGIYLNQRMPLYNVPMQSQDRVDEFFKDRRLDKVARANIIIPHLVNNPIFVSENIGEDLFEKIKAELMSFPDGEHDDFCLEGNTLVATTKGNKPIKDIKPGDMVITPLGNSEVTVCGITGYKETIHKFGLEATADHKVFTGKSFDKLGDISYDVLLDTLTYKGIMKWQYKKQLYLMEKNTVLWGRESIISVKAQQMLGESVLKDFTLRCGNIIAERKFRKGMSFIIKMVMCLTTITATWSAYQGTNTLRNIWKNLKIGVQHQSGKLLLLKIVNWLKYGMQAKKEESGTRNTLKELWNAKDKNSFAQIVVESSKRVLYQDKQTNMESNSVAGAMTNTTKERNAHSRKPVYNLTTKAGCFYANGILVSNCDTLIDAVKFCYNREPSILDVL